MTLFLDFDGVLHPNSAFRVRGRPTLRGDGALFMWTPLLVTALEDLPNIKIVLSTSWARELTFSRACRYLPNTIRTRVIGSTWHSSMAFQPDGFKLPKGSTWWDSATRYQQIKRYVTRSGLTDWLAVDDDGEGWAEAELDRLIHTSGELGLSDATVLTGLTRGLSSQAVHVPITPPPTP